MMRNTCTKKLIKPIMETNIEAVLLMFQVIKLFEPAHMEL